MEAPADATPPPAPRRHPLQKAAALAAAAGLVAVCVAGVLALSRELAGLRQEQEHARTAAVIGYRGITPVLSWAERPNPWIQEQGDNTLIWGGWKKGQGHLWFRVGRGELDPALMSVPIGRDVVQAIDAPLTERSGGDIWGRIPDEAPVAAPRLGGVDTAYPLLVLDKVLVVNDTINGEPYLVTSNPAVAESQRVAVYETKVDGVRVTMGLTGYYLGVVPLLYDRGTESLWAGDTGSLRAVAGAYKGRSLRQVARPAPVSWGAWRSGHPGGRLVVGADRSYPRPQL